MNPRPAHEALVRMLFPSAGYRRVESFPQSQLESPDAWKQHAEEILDGLSFDVELNIKQQYLPEEVSDLTGEATIEPRSRAKAVGVISQIGQMMSDREAELRGQLQDAVVLDLQNLAPVLFGPSNAWLRSLEGVSQDVPCAWMEVVDATGALPQFIDFATRLLSVDDLDWFLSNAQPPSRLENHDVGDVMEAVSRYGGDCRPQGKGEEFQGYAEVFIAWCARSKGWKSSHRLAAIYLANTLTDPDRRLCLAMESNGFKFSIENVSWTDVLDHLSPPDKKSFTPSDVQDFLVKYATALATAWPQWAAQPAKGDKEGSPYSIKNFDQGTTLRSMLVNIEKDDERAQIQASIDRVILASATPKPNKPSVPSRRL